MIVSALGSIETFDMISDICILAEHVFELHMVKDFFVWLFQDQGLTCQALQNIWGIDGNGVDNNANLLMQQLAWYDPVTGQGTLSELFVLNRGLNQLKGAVSSKLHCW